MGNKIFKNLDEQVEILKQKNLTINDVNYAKEVLLRENYFFLNGIVIHLLNHLIIKFILMELLLKNFIVYFYLIES